MTIVPLEELQRRLGEYVKRSGSGEHILITEQGQEIAELTPVDPLRKAMTAFLRRGKVTWTGDKPKGLRDIVVKGGPVSETALKDRR